MKAACELYPKYTMWAQRTKLTKVAILCCDKANLKIWLLVQEGERKLLHAFGLLIVYTSIIHACVCT